MTRSESLNCDAEFLHTSMQRRLYVVANRLLAKAGFFEAVVTAEEMLLDPDYIRVGGMRPLWAGSVRPYETHSDEFTYSVN